MGAIPTGPVGPASPFPLGICERVWAHPATASPNKPATNCRFMIPIVSILGNGRPRPDPGSHVAVFRRRRPSRPPGDLSDCSPRAPRSAEVTVKPAETLRDPAVEIGHYPLGVDRRDAGS